MDCSVSEAMGENATPEIKEDPKERMDARYRAIERPDPRCRKENGQGKTVGCHGSPERGTGKFLHGL